MKTQRELILEYMKTHGSITPREAEEHCRGCMRLGARIWDLKAEGHPIKTEVVHKKREDGSHYCFARYSLS